MRVLVLSHNYPRYPGDPAGAFVARIAVAAAAAGHEVRVLAPHAPGLAQREDQGGVRLHRFRYAPEALERVAYTGDLHRRARRSPVSALMVPVFLAGFLRAARRVAGEFQPDVVHAHWWMPGGWVAARLGLPFVITCHGSDVRLLEHAWVRPVARPVFRRAGAVTAVSRFLASDLSRLLGDAAGGIRPLVMPVDADTFAAGRTTTPADPPRILYAGNLVPSKGVDILIRAYAALRKAGVRCQLKILGEGPVLGSLRELAHSLGCEEIVWSRFVPQDRMPAEYGASAVTVLPTRGQAEGLGLTLVEALLAGSAVVGTPAGGIPEVISDGTTGLLVPDGDPDRLAEAIGRLLADERLRRSLVAEGQRRVSARFGAQAAVAPFLALYHELAAR